MAKDILLSALHGERTEMPPWLPHIGTHAAQLLNVSAATYLQDAELLARGAQLCAERYACDGIPLVDDPQLEAISLGCTPQWSEQAPPSVIASPVSALPAEQVIERLPPLPDESTGRFPTVIQAGKLARPALVERDVALVGVVAGPCTIAYHLRGLALFTDMFRYPDVATELFAYAGRVSAVSARIYAEVIGCDVVAVNDTPATMLQPPYFRRFVLPNLQPAWQVIHSSGKTSSLWA